MFSTLSQWFLPDCLRAPPLQYILAVIAATVITGFSKGGFGGGLGVISTPLLMLVLPAQVAVSMMLPILIVCDIFTLRQFPREWDPPSFRALGSGAAVGLLGGLALLLYFSRETVDGDRWIRLMVGVVSLGFCLLQLVRRRFERGANRDRSAGLKTGVGLGLLAGVTTMVAHAAGPVVNMYLLLRRLDRQTFVGTAARYFLTLNLVKVPLFILASAVSGGHYITWQTLRWGLWLLPLCPLSVAAGAWLNRRLNAVLFTRIIYALLFVAGLRMLIDALH